MMDHNQIRLILNVIKALFYFIKRVMCEIKQVTSCQSSELEDENWKVKQSICPQCQFFFFFLQKYIISPFFSLTTKLIIKQEYISVKREAGSGYVCVCSLLLSESLHHVCLPPGGWIAEVAWRRGVKFEVVSDELCSVLVESCFFPVIFQVAACPCSALAPSTSTTLCLSEQIKIFSKKLGRN